MPRKRGNRWAAYGYDPTTKQKKYLGTRDTKTEARDLEDDWRKKRRRTGATTCDEFAKTWTETHPRPRESTNIHNRERLNGFISDFKGVKLTDVDRPAARVWALKHKWEYATVRAMFTDAVNDGLCDINPFASLRIPGSRGRKDIVALTEKELVALADKTLDPKCEFGDFGHEYRAMLLFAGYVGLRPGELFALRRDDLHGQLCTIERALSSKTGEIGQTKNGKARTVIVPPAAQDALSAVPPHPSGLLFTSPREQQWTQGSHFYYWKTLRREAGRPGFDFYELRHAAATMLLERGVSHADVAVQLGHTDGGALVMSTYGHPAEAGARARMLAAYDQATGPTPISGAIREQQLKEAQ